MITQEQADRIERKLDELLAFKVTLMKLLTRFGGKYLEKM